MEKTLYVTKIHAVLDLEWKPRCQRAVNRPFHALSFRVGGNADFYHGDTHLTAKTGDVLFVPHYYDYLQDAHEDERLYCIHFDLADDSELEPFLHHPRQPKTFLDDFAAMNRMWLEQKPGYEYAILSVINRILENITIERSRKTVNRPVEQAISYLNRSFASPELSVSSLAAMLGISETYLRKLFYAQVGVSPHRYIAGLRLQHATQLLQSGYYTVEETAVRCGFLNAKNFATFIRHETGRTPSELKKTEE